MRGQVFPKDSRLLGSYQSQTLESEDGCDPRDQEMSFSIPSTKRGRLASHEVGDTALSSVHTRLPARQILEACESRAFCHPSRRSTLGVKRLAGFPNGPLVSSFSARPARQLCPRSPSTARGLRSRLHTVELAPTTIAGVEPGPSATALRGRVSQAHEGSHGRGVVGAQKL